MNKIKEEIINFIRTELNEDLGVDIDVSHICIEDIYAEMCKETLLNINKKEHRLRIYNEVILYNMNSNFVDI